MSGSSRSSRSTIRRTVAVSGGEGEVSELRAGSPRSRVRDRMRGMRPKSITLDKGTVSCHDTGARGARGPQRPETRDFEGESFVRPGSLPNGYP